MQGITSSVTKITVAKASCNEITINKLDLSPYKALEEVVCGARWQEEVERMRGEFEERRTQFLRGLEQLPGFLQSVFLPLDRKLMQKYAM